MAAVVGVLGFNVIVFGVGAAQRSDAPRVPALLGLLGSAYLVLVALGLPNPGLRGVALLVAAVTVPLVVLTPPSGVFDRALGPMLGGLGLALAFLAWLVNASPAMVVAPVLPVVVDVIYTLVMRLITREGRSGLSGRGWWKAIEAWASPGDDLVAQRAYASSKSMALVWFVGVTVVVLVLSLATWWVGVPWLVAQLLLLVPALGWLVLQAPWFQASQRNLLVGLGLVTLVGLAGTVLAWRQDGRVAMLILPLSLAAVVWATALLINRNTLLPAKMPG
jgi:magnesium-transporting ATPase (P-type)